MFSSSSLWMDYQYSHRGINEKTLWGRFGPLSSTGLSRLCGRNKTQKMTAAMTECFRGTVEHLYCKIYINAVPCDCVWSYRSVVNVSPSIFSIKKRVCRCISVPLAVCSWAINLSRSHHSTQKHITCTHDYKGKAFTGFQWHKCANANRGGGEKKKYIWNICKGRHGHFLMVWHSQ